MEKFEIEIRRVSFITYEIEAQDIESAEEKAIERAIIEYGDENIANYEIV